MTGIKPKTPTDLTSFPNQKSKKIHKYEVQETLGKSKNIIKKAVLRDYPKNLVAIKFFPQNSSILNSKHSFDKESEIYSKLNHPNILKMYESIEEEIDIKSQNRIFILRAIVLEYASKGELYNYIKDIGPFDEDMARIIFKQILMGVQYLHENGIAHMDLKLNNILINDDYSIKIADFDLNQPTSKLIFGNKIGTPGYLAPEIIEGNTYTGIQADIFTLGVNLFAICSGRMPFSQASENDIFYQCIRANNQKIYWKKFGDNIPKFSDQLKDLICKLLSYKPENRPSISEILDCEWVRMGKEDKTLYQKEMKLRYLKLSKN